MIVSNYIPISLIPLFSKIFERLMHKRIMDFLIKQNILSKKQYGFQKNKSTEHAILDIQSKIIDAFENKEKSCCIFLDFAKAFDTVNHTILLRKLYYYGIRGETFNWLQSYLSNRKQCVQIGNAKSDFLKIDCGVPQGSVLGPLLFLIYINDIAESSPTLDFNLFADDTSIFFKHKNGDEMEEILNRELDKVSNWLKANKLSLNVNKSSVLAFRSKSENSEKILNLQINNELLEEKIYTKYLGIYIDHKLTWKYETEHINSKLIKGNAILAKMRHYIPEKVIKNLYNELIQPHLDYGALIWGKAAEIHLDKIHRSLNKTMRIINFKKATDDVIPIYAISKILTLENNVKFLQGKFIWKLIHSRLPESINDIFTNHGAILSDREQDIEIFKMRLPNQRTNHGLSFIIYSGVKLWNQKLTNDIKQTDNEGEFKSKLKAFLLHQIN